MLGSGSGGNASVVRCGSRLLLMDAGLGPRTVGRRLRSAGHAIADIGGVCVTHFDRDHFRPSWITRLLLHEIPLWVHRWHLPRWQKIDKTGRLEEAGLLRPYGFEWFQPIEGWDLWPVHLIHDSQGTFGFRVQTPGGALGYATDLGRVAPDLIEHFSGVDLLAIESNYDPELQRLARRPKFVKRRVTGGSGHLSNEEALAAARAIADRSRPGLPHRIVLLHPSRQANAPEVIRDVFAREPRFDKRVVLTRQGRRTRWITGPSCGPMERDQMILGFDGQAD